MNKINDGVIYTRKWVVDFMLDLIGYSETKNLSQIKIVEPCCGEGSFLEEIVKRLCESAKRNKTNVEKLISAASFYEIDSDSIEIAKNNVFEILIRYFDKKSSNDLIKAWFHCSDFIKCQEENVDIVIGNPPYVRATDIPLSLRKFYSSILNTFTLGTDMYVAFIEKGLRTLSKQGKLIFICSDRWQKNQYGKKIRKFIEDNYYVNFNCKMHDVDCFERNVTAYPAITLISHQNSKTFNFECTSEFSETDAKTILKFYKKPIKELIPKGNFYCCEEVQEKFQQIPTLEESDITLGIGIATGKDDVFIVKNKNVVEESRLLPLAYGRDIVDGKLPDNPVRWLINPWEKNKKLVNLDDYPRLENYFANHRIDLISRYISKKNPNEWYKTVDKVIPGLVNKQKLLVKDISQRIDPILDEGRFYPHHNFYWMTSDIWDLKVLGGILLSDLLNHMIANIGVRMRGGSLRLQAQYLRKLRIPKYSSILPEYRNELRHAFESRDIKLASSITNRIYQQYE